MLSLSPSAQLFVKGFVIGWSRSIFLYRQYFGQLCSLKMWSEVCSKHTCMYYSKGKKCCLMNSRQKSVPDDFKISIILMNSDTIIDNYVMTFSFKCVCCFFSLLPATLFQRPRFSTILHSALWVLPGHSEIFQGFVFQSSGCFTTADPVSSAAKCHMLSLPCWLFPTAGSGHCTSPSLRLLLQSFSQCSA